MICVGIFDLASAPLPFPGRSDKRRIRLAGTGHGLDGTLRRSPRPRQVGAAAERARCRTRTRRGGSRRVAAPALSRLERTHGRGGSRRGAVAGCRPRRGRLGGLVRSAAAGRGVCVAELHPVQAWPRSDDGRSRRLGPGQGFCRRRRRDLGRLSGRTSWRCRLFSATRRRHARRRGPARSLVFGGWSELAHRRVSSFLPGMINTRDEPWRANRSLPVASEAADKRHVEATVHRRRVRSKYGERVNAPPHSSPAAGETRARRWCRRTRTSSTARH